MTCKLFKYQTIRISNPLSYLLRCIWLHPATNPIFYAFLGDQFQNRLKKCARSMSSHFPSSWRPSTRASIGDDLTTQNRTNQTSIAEDYGKKSIVSPDLSAPLLRVQRNVFTRAHRFGDSGRDCGQPLAASVSI